MDKGRKSLVGKMNQRNQENQKDSRDSVKHCGNVGDAKGGRRHGNRGWIFGLLVGAVFLYIGAADGELAVIWQKAVMICMECIGIG